MRVLHPDRFHTAHSVLKPRKITTHWVALGWWGWASMRWTVGWINNMWVVVVRETHLKTRRMSPTKSFSTSTSTFVSSRTWISTTIQGWVWSRTIPGRSQLGRRWFIMETEVEMKGCQWGVFAIRLFSSHQGSKKWTRLYLRSSHRAQEDRGPLTLLLCRALQILSLILISHSDRWARSQTSLWVLWMPTMSFHHL